MGANFTFSRPSGGSSGPAERTAHVWRHLVVAPRQIFTIGCPLTVQQGPGARGFKIISGDLKAYNLKVIEFETYTYQTKDDWHSCWFQTDYCGIKIKFSLILL